MDIEFIEQKDRDNIFRLMEMCGIDMSQAYQLYTNANNNVQTAMQMHFNEAPSHNNQFDQYGGSHHAQFNEYPAQSNDFDNDDFDSLYQKYKIYRQTGKKFQQNYQIRKQHGFLGGIGKLFKGSSQPNFKKQLETYFGRPCAIQFSGTSLSQTLAESDKFPVILYFLDFNLANKPKVEQILRSNQFADMVNIQFKNFGIDSHYNMEKSLQKIIDRKKYNNCLLIVRVNAIEQIQVLQNIPLLSSNTKQVLQKLKLVKNTCISKDLDDGHLQKRFNQQLMGNFEYEKPMSIIEKRKIAQDRQIRKKQQQEFYASMKVEEEKSRKNSENSNNQYEEKPRTNPTYPTHHVPGTQATVSKPQPPKRNLPEERQQLRNKLRTYTEGMNIKLRLPSGQSTVLTVSMDEKVKYLYDYVMSIDKDTGFERDADRKFNIIRPYDKLNLTEIQNKTLREAFEGSDNQSLVVSETE